MTTAIIVPDVPSIVQAPIHRETASERAARLLDAGLSAGVRVLSHHHSNYRVTSGHGAADHTVFSRTFTEDPERLEWCNCEWGKKQGDIETYNVGTAQQHSNGKAPCTHVLVVRWWNLTVWERELVAVAHPRLARWVRWGNTYVD